MIAALGVTVTLWASAFVAIRFAGRALAPGPLALGRLMVAAWRSASSCACALSRCPPPYARLHRHLRRAVARRLQRRVNAAERRIDAGTASLLVNTAPIFLAILAGTILREGFPRDAVRRLRDGVRRLSR